MNFYLLIIGMVLSKFFTLESKRWRGSTGSTGGYSWRTEHPWGAARPAALQRHIAEKSRVRESESNTKSYHHSSLHTPDYAAQTQPGAHGPSTHVTAASNVTHHRKRRWTLQHLLKKSTWCRYAFCNTCSFCFVLFFLNRPAANCLVRPFRDNNGVTNAAAPSA